MSQQALIGLSLIVIVAGSVLFGWILRLQYEKWE
jgi:hypothetical protein